MKFVQFTRRADPQKLVHYGAQITSAAGKIKIVELGQGLLKDALQEKDFLQRTKALADRAPAAHHLSADDDVDLLAPVTHMDKVLCIGMNYKDHCEEQNVPLPEEPVVFNKFPSTVCGPCANVPYPKVTQELDWEVELAVVIGKAGRDIKEADAMDHVFGYAVANDVSARDWQLRRNAGQWLLGKAMDGFCPLGPCLVTRDEFGRWDDKAMRTRVNGREVQASSTKEMVFGVPAVIEWLSRFCTLLPGDVVLTGTPPGVGVFRQPPEFIRPGDKVECEIEGIGSICNEFVA